MGCLCSGGNAIQNDESQPPSGPNNEENNQPPVDNQQEGNQIRAIAFTFAQLVAATDHFNTTNILGEGGFGKVYKANLQANDQIVAIKKLNPEGNQRIDDFFVEVSNLSGADHPNLVKLIGYCAQEQERLLVYEYLPLGSVDDHLHGLRPNSIRLDWNARMKIAAGAARGLAYLHHEMDPPIIYRDLKTSNILLSDEEFHVKLSDFGFAKAGPYSHCASEYAMTGQLTVKTNMYSFGVVLLELITGRIAFDVKKHLAEENLVVWAQPMFKDRNNVPRMVDPALEGVYPSGGLDQVLAMAAMCVQSNPNLRPSAADVLASLNDLASQQYDPQIHDRNLDQGEG